jgi:nicotinate-nucleotide adenylyltransferase
MGGTFDPIHFGHIKPALELLHKLSLQEIRFIPCRIPPHRSMPKANSEQRWAMLNIVISSQPGFVADARELRREGPSYTVDTLTELRDELGQERPLCLIMGDDAFSGLTSWYHWETILRLAHIIVLGRPGSKLPDEGPLAELLVSARLKGSQYLPQSPHGGILPCEVTPVKISSTAIRKCIQAGESPRFMLPGRVWAYIKQHQLYGVDNICY